MTPTRKIADWNDADVALGRLGELRRRLAALVVMRDDSIQVAKSYFATSAAPLTVELEKLEEELQAFVESNQGDLDGRSKKLERGRLGLLLVKRLRVRNIKRAIAWLLEAKKLLYLRVKYELNKEALTDAPAEILKAIGAKITPHDQFWYEVDGERYAVGE